MLGSFVLIMTILVPSGEDIVKNIGNYDKYTSCFYETVDLKETYGEARTFHCEYHEDLEHTGYDWKIVKEDL